MSKIIVTATALIAAMLALPALATPCDEVKAKIAKKIEAKGVKAYTLDAVAAADVKDQKVVGVCEGGKMKIVYARGAGKAAKAEAAAPAPAAPAAEAAKK